MRNDLHVLLGAVGPDAEALRLFLAPYATEARLVRLAEGDPPGFPNYLADYRAWFETGAPRPGRGFVDTEAAGYVLMEHYWRAPTDADPVEYAVHVAMAGAVAYGAHRGEAALTDVCAVLPRLRAPLLASIAAEHLLWDEERRTDNEDRAHRELAMLLLVANMPEHAGNVSLTESLVAAVTARRASGSDTAPSVSRSRRARIEDTDWDASEADCRTECVLRDLPGPYAGGRIREALLALRSLLVPEATGPHEPPSS